MTNMAISRRNPYRILKACLQVVMWLGAYMNMTTKTELSKPKPRMNMVSISTSIPLMVQIPLLITIKGKSPKPPKTSVARTNRLLKTTNKPLTIVMMLLAI